MPDEKVTQEALLKTKNDANDTSNASEEDTSDPASTDPRQDDPDAEIESESNAVSSK